MSDKKISQLPAVTDVQDGDEYVVVRSGANYKITGASLSAALGGAGPQPGALYARLSIPGGVDSGADVTVPLVGTFASGDPTRNIDAMALTGPSTLAPAATRNGFILAPSAIPAGKVLTLNYAEFMLSNGAGTEKLRLEYDGAPIEMPEALGVRYWVPFADCSVAEQIGSDLTLVSFDNGGYVPATGLAGIQTTAGGQFFQELLVTLGYTGES